MNNPFLSNTFVKIWNKHFKANNKTHRFKFIPDVTFSKRKYAPIYTNIGANLTNGMNYSLMKDTNEFNDYKNKVFLVYDVPTYFNVDTTGLNGNSRLKVKKSTQYEGILTELSSYESFEDFFSSKFKSKTRYNIKKKKRLLEKDFDITYSVYDHTITDEQYEFVSESLRNLIATRFNSLKKENQILTCWDYYKELMLPMLREKTAVIITVNDNGIPIGMTFNFLSDDVLFYAITTFGIKYLNYNIGHTTILEISKWCFENGKTIIDFSKGDAEYKSRWQTNEYNFEHHILYDSKSLTATFYATVIFRFLNFKQFLREKRINVLVSKIKYLIKPNK
jgi:hypothetical protein